MNPARPTRTSGNAVRKHGTWALVCLIVFAFGRAQAQHAATGEYQIYALKHKSATDVEKVLSEMLTGSGHAVHVVADVKANQILLRGPQSAQQVARQLIESLDSPPNPPPDARLIVKSYPCPEGRQAEVVARLRSVYQSQGEVRVAADPQSGQILVLAPAPVHAEIAQREALTTRPAQQPAAGLATRPAEKSATHAGPNEQFVALLHVRINDVETTLRELFRERLIPLAERPGGGSVYRHVSARAQAVELAFDGQRNGVNVRGAGRSVDQWARLIRSLDVPWQSGERTTEVLPLRYADPRKLHEAVEAYRGGAAGAGAEAPPMRQPRSNPDQQGHLFDHGGVELVSYLFQARADGPGSEGPAAAPPPGPQPLAPQDQPPAAPEEDRLRRLREMGLDVEIETLPELDAIIIRGRKRDVEEVKRIIQEIERLSAETEPAIDIYMLRHVQGEALSTIIRQVQADVLAGRQGRVTILPLGKPNALLLIGWGEAVKKAKELIAKLDQPVDPQSQQRVYRLRYASATTVASTISQFFAAPAGLQPRVQITADPRSNSLVVQAAPRDLADVEMLLEKLDTPDSAAVFRTRIFKLYNTLANDVYATLQGAIDAARGGGAAGQKSAALELLSVDPQDANRSRLLRSGILNDVRITPDPRLNILIVAAPAESMELLAALIRELDAPGAVAQIKVFRIENADANTMVQMLRTLLPAQPGAGPQLSVAEGEPSTMGLRFSTDARTNSIIAIGSTGDLRIVEALILRLDALDVQQRKTVVYRLKNAPATDVANAVNRFLSSERLVQLAVPGAFSPFQQLETEVVVVPEPVSNALIISATPRFFQEINDLVEKLDAQPSQVMIQVLIAEVTLRDTSEMGVELGLQDSVLFDRSVLAGNLTTQTTSSQQSTPSGIITQTEQNFPAATLNPGYLFNSPILGNGGGKRAMEGANRVGGQGLSNLAVGRINSELGFGGLVLAASSESVSVLIRALQECNRLEVLGRPHIMTLDNQPAFIQIGKRVPRITGSMAPTLGTGQVFNTFELVNVGLILGVTPRISPDGMVVMEIDAEKSELGPENEGIPISISEGTVIRSPTFNTTMAQTTVSAADGETIVLGGLITKSTSKTERKVPLLGDIPVAGMLFRYEASQCRRSELLIVLTPHVVRTQEDAERIKRIESARMHWCLGSVQEIHGEGNLTGAETVGQVIYPAVNPRGVPSSKPDGLPEPIPTPAPLEEANRLERLGPGLVPQGAALPNHLRRANTAAPIGASWPTASESAAAGAVHYQPVQRAYPSEGAPFAQSIPSYDPGLPTDPALGAPSAAVGFPPQ